ncbi:NXPE family member 3-like [Arapaima gigas]
MIEYSAINLAFSQAGYSELDPDQTRHCKSPTLLSHCAAAKKHSGKMTVKIKKNQKCLILLFVVVIVCTVFWYYMKDLISSRFIAPDSVSYLIPSYLLQNPIRNSSFLSTPTYCPTTTFTKPQTSSTYVTITKEEWDSLLEELRWPSPATEITSPRNATDAKKCSFTVVNLMGDYIVGDIVNVSVVAKDSNGAPKTYGGDFFQAKLYNTELKASTFGSVVDHCNGTYTVSFALLWPGPARISIRLIHSSEAVQILSQQRERDPDKVFFYGYFEEGDQKETVMCNAMKSQGLNINNRSCCCEYPDLFTGEIWFCRRPASLPCSALVYHSMGGYQAKLSRMETEILGSSKDIVIPGDSPVINILSTGADIRETKRCVRGLDTPVPSGFFFQDRWSSKVCSMQAFPKDEMLRCLRDKEVHMMGDSTLRQWFEYIGRTLPALELIKRHTSEKSGPLLMVNAESNIFITWRAHGLPLRTTKTPMADLHFIANELNGLAGGKNSIIVFNLWAHFTTYPVHLFVQRVATIRMAVLSLLRRAPNTLVVIKSANTGYKDVYGSDWLSWQLDSALRAMFRGLPVVLIDVWQMTSCHYAHDDIHPPPVVIQNEVDLFLSFVCPQ